MAKVDPVTGKVIRRADGKILKPEGWTPPQLELFTK
jgi:predicted HAD superfamily Cof-like phosphohydrolase